MNPSEHLYEKFTVTRTDGRDQRGGDKEGAKYFVLCYTHDPIAQAGVELMADLYEQEGDKEFANELRETLNQMIAGIPPGEGEQSRNPPDLVTQGDLILMRYRASQRLG